MELPDLDPPPISFAPPSNMQFNFSQPGVINLPGHSQPRPLSHPPYEEMIRRALVSLNEKEGSSRQKIARYIENEFGVSQPSSDSSHNSELTQELRRMKANGQVVIVRHSYILANAPPPQPQALPSVGPYAGPSVPPFAGTCVQSPASAYVQSSLAPAAVYDGPKRRPGRPPKLQPIVGSTVITPTTTPTPSPSLPVGFAAFSPKQLGVPTTNLFGGLTPAASPYQFGAGPVSNVSTTGLVNGPVNTASTILPVNGPPNGVPTMTLANGPVTHASPTGPVSGSVSNVLITSPVGGPLNNVPGMSGPVSNALLTSPISGPMNHVPTIGLVSSSNVSSISPISGAVSDSGPVFDQGALAKVGPSEQIAESRVDSVMVGIEPESSAGPIVVSAAEDPAVAQKNDEPMVITAVENPTVEQNISGPSTVFIKRGRGRPPKINGGPKKIWKQSLYIRKRGRRGRPKQVNISTMSSNSTMSLRPRGRPRKNAVAIDQANQANGGGGVLPVAKIPWDPRGSSSGRQNKELGASSLSSEICLMAYQGLKARYEHTQNKIKSMVSIVKPCLDESACLHENAVAALEALQDIEDFANMDVIGVPIADQTIAVNVQGAPGVDLNAPVTAKDLAMENSQSLASTGEDAQLTVQGRRSDAEPVQGQQEPPFQSSIP